MRLPGPFRGILSLLVTSLRTKIIVWCFVPTAIILVAVALLTFYAYQDVTEDLVIERDQDLTRLSADQLATELLEFTDILGDVARMPAISQSDPAALRQALAGVGGPAAAFDGGIVVLDTFGKVVAVEPERPELLGQDWSGRNHFRKLVRSQRPVFSDVLPDGPQGADVVTVAVPVIGPRAELLGSVHGLFRVDRRQ